MAGIIDALAQIIERNRLLVQREALVQSPADKISQSGK